jgi:disease resistance protein RPM1
MGALPKNNCGSRIIMTTRIKGLTDSSHCGCDTTVYEMEGLGSYDGCPDDTDLRDYDNIARTYDGLPMNTVAGAHLEKEGWLAYQDDTLRVGSPAPPLETAHELELAEKRILLSYIDLDPCLKTHMMLLCMFPQSFQIERNLLIRIWTAEGYANSASEAEDILEKLIDRNAILPVEREDISQVEAWKVCHVMFEAIQLHSAEDNFLISSSMHRLTTRNKVRVRRLALHFNCPELNLKRSNKLDLSYVSSLFIFSKASKVNLDKFIHLRVLNIMGWKRLKDNDLRQICILLLMLRYLGIRNTRVRKIPPTIINLRHLETLDVRKTRVNWLPSQVGRLPKLSNLLVGSEQDPSYNTRVVIATGFQYFGSLRTLETIHLSDAWPLLSSLEQLAEVTIFCPFPDPIYSQDKLCQSLKQCRRLESLTFYGSLGCSMEFLHSLHDPPRNLRKLTVTENFVTIPRWIATLKNLMLLQIKVCRLSLGDLQNLSELPVLQRLLLGLDFLPDKEMVINGFPALERFSVDCRVPLMVFQLGAMPKLIELELKFRDGPANQRSAPSGINHLLNLKRVVMYYSSWCQSSLSVRAIVKAMVTAVHDHRGPVKLVINGSNIDVQRINGDQAAIQEHATENASGHAGPSS